MQNVVHIYYLGYLPRNSNKQMRVNTKQHYRVLGTFAAKLFRTLSKRMAPCSLLFPGEQKKIGSKWYRHSRYWRSLYCCCMLLSCILFDEFSRQQIFSKNFLPQFVLSPKKDQYLLFLIKVGTIIIFGNLSPFCFLRSFVIVDLNT